MTSELIQATAGAQGFAAEAISMDEGEDRTYSSTEVRAAIGLTGDQFRIWLSRNDFTPEHEREGRTHALTFGDTLRLALVDWLSNKTVTLSIAGRVVHQLPRTLDDLYGRLFVVRLTPSLQSKLVAKGEADSTRGADIVVDLDNLARRLELELLPGYAPGELAERNANSEDGTAQPVEQFVRNLLALKIVRAGTDGRLGFEDSALAFIAWLTRDLRLSDDELRGVVAGLRWQHGAPEAGADAFGRYRRLWRVEGERRTPTLRQQRTRRWRSHQKSSASDHLARPPGPK